MTNHGNQTPKSISSIRVERTFLRFSNAQRWEHLITIIAIALLLFTGLPQKFQDSNWSQWLISTPEKLELLQQIHHLFALLLTAEVLYHLGRGIYWIATRRLQGDIFPTWRDVQDAFHMIKYLLFLTKAKPKFGKYNFEQKITYWFVFFSVAIMVISGIILWFPIQITKVFPGGVIPAAFLAHSNEAIAFGIFIVIWHFYHVHFQRLNLSMFTGSLSEKEMCEHHVEEYERLIEQDDLSPDNQ